MKVRAAALIFVIFSLNYNFIFAEDTNCGRVVLSSADKETELLNCWEYSPEGAVSYEEAGEWRPLDIPETVIPAGVRQGGVYWIRGRFYLDGPANGLSLSLDLGPIDSADETYLNGVLIGSNGEITVVGTRLPREEFRKPRIYTIPSSALIPGATNLIVILVRDGVGLPEVSGIYGRVPSVASTPSVYRRFYSESALELVYLSIMILMWITFVAFAVKRPENREFFYLSVFLASLSVLSFFRSQWDSILGIPSPLSMRMEEIAGIMTPALFIPFLEELLDPGSQGRYRVTGSAVKPSRVFLIFTLLLSLSMMIAGGHAEIFALMLRYITVVYLFAIAIAAAAVIGGIRNNSRDAAYVIWSFVPLLLALVFELMERRGTVSPADYNGTAAVLFLGALSVVVSSRFIRMQKSVMAANAELTLIDGLKDRFISNVSKELAEPLKLIRDTVSALIASNKPSPISTKEDYLKMGAELRRADSLFERVFAASKIDVGEIKAVIRNVPLAPIVYDVAASLSELAERKKVSVEIAPFELVSAPVDPGLLKTVLFEILSNAVHYSLTGGKVVLYVRDLVQSVEIAVADEGIGIGIEESTLIFQKYYRSPEAEKYHPLGKGLGLYIAAQLVRELKGSVRCVRRENEKGSLFIVTLKKNFRQSKNDSQEAADE